MSDSRYFIDEEKGVVVCVIDDCAADTVLDFINSIHDKLIINPNELPNRFRMKNEFKGIARLAPDDVWDENVGKDLAFDRAYHDYVIDKRNKMRDIVKYYTNQMNQILNAAEHKADKVKNR